MYEGFGIMANHKCRTCGGTFDCGYGDNCSSKWQRIDCHLCYNDYVAMGRIEDLI
jgi:hypothetical protein